MATTALLAEIVIIGMFSCVWIVLIITGILGTPLAEIIRYGDGGRWVTQLLVGVVIAFPVGSIINTLAYYIPELLLKSTRVKIFKNANLKYVEARAVVFECASSAVHSDLGIERTNLRLARAGLINFPMIAVGATVYAFGLDRWEGWVFAVAILCLLLGVGCCFQLRHRFERYYKRMVDACKVITELRSELKEYVQVVPKVPGETPEPQPEPRTLKSEP